jgi:hypothetical protein
VTLSANTINCNFQQKLLSFQTARCEWYHHTYVPWEKGSSHWATIQFTMRTWSTPPKLGGYRVYDDQHVGLRVGLPDVPFLSELSCRPNKYGTGRHTVPFFPTVPFYYKVTWKLYVTHPLCMANTCSQFACAVPPIDTLTIISYRLI